MSFLRQKIRNISIGWKYGFALGTTIILFLISASVILNEITNVHANLKTIEEKSRNTVVISDLSSIFWAKDAPIADYVNTSNRKYIAEFEDWNQRFDELLAEWKTTLLSGEDLKQLETIESYNRKMNDQFLGQIVPAMESGNTTSAVLIRDETQLVRNGAVESLSHLRNRIIKEQQLTVAEAEESLDRSIRVLFTSILVSSVLGVMVVWLVHLFVRRHLKQVIGMASRIAEGRLDIGKNGYDGKDEVGELSAAANTMLENLRDMVRRISDVSGMVNSYSEELTHSAHAVNESSRQVAVTMNELAEGTVTQAESATELSDAISAYMAKIEETRTNGERMRQTSHKVLELTDQGRKLMDGSIRQMNAIEHIMHSATDSMRGLDDRLKEISALGGVIHTIADQTRFLSLNAAIEAAHAGEHGRGFAIVADEVRKLAEHAAKSSTEIAGIVSGILHESGQVAGSLAQGYDEVRKGIVQIQTTGDTFNEINQSVADMADQISATSEHLTEIADGSGSIMRSIENIASVSEEAAAAVEQTSASMQQTSSAMEEIAGGAEHLASLAEDLSRLVRQFRT